MKGKHFLGAAESEKRVILPVTHRRRGLAWYIKRLFFLFLMIFLVVCIRVLWLYAQSESEALLASVATFFVEQSIGMPK